MELIEDSEEGVAIDDFHASDDGVRYTLEDLQESNKLLNLDAVF